MFKYIYIYTYIPIYVYISTHICIQFRFQTLYDCVNNFPFTVEHQSECRFLSIKENTKRNSVGFLRKQKYINSASYLVYFNTARGSDNRKQFHQALVEITECRGWGSVLVWGEEGGGNAPVKQSKDQRPEFIHRTFCTHVTPFHFCAIQALGFKSEGIRTFVEIMLGQIRIQTSFHTQTY